MLKIVLDTNVLVSGLLSPFNKPADILRLIVAGQLQLCVDARILAEYREVLYRPKFQFDRSRIEILLDYLRGIGEPVMALPLPDSLPDPGDIPFLEVAVAGDVKYLVTGNVSHFPQKYRSVHVVTPADFMKIYRKSFET